MNASLASRIARRSLCTRACHEELCLCCTGMLVHLQCSYTRVSRLWLPSCIGMSHARGLPLMYCMSFPLYLKSRHLPCCRMLVSLRWPMSPEWQQLQPLPLGHHNRQWPFQQIWLLTALKTRRRSQDSSQ